MQSMHHTKTSNNEKELTFEATANPLNERNSRDVHSFPLYHNTLKCLLKCLKNTEKSFTPRRHDTVVFSSLFFFYLTSHHPWRTDHTNRRTITSAYPHVDMHHHMDWFFFFFQRNKGAEFVKSPNNQTTSDLFDHRNLWFLQFIATVHFRKNFLVLNELSFGVWICEFVESWIGFNPCIWTDRNSWHDMWHDTIWS